MKRAAKVRGFTAVLSSVLVPSAALFAAPPAVAAPNGSAAAPVFAAQAEQSLPEPLPPVPSESASDGNPRQMPEPVVGRKAGNDLSGNVPTLLRGDVSLIDLDSALRLAGVENPQIRIASQRIAEAVAARQLSAAQILPSLNGGTGYDNHTGNLQQVNGSILSVNRSSLYAGAGALAVGSGTVQIPGVLWNLNVSQSAFTYLQSRQMVKQQEFATLATRNEMLLQVVVAYLELLRAAELRLIAMGIRDGTGKWPDSRRITLRAARGARPTPTEPPQSYGNARPRSFNMKATSWSSRRPGRAVELESSIAIAACR